MKLRPYQQQAVDEVCAHLARSRSTLAVLPTGTGKTVIFSHVAHRFAAHGRVMVIAHRGELLQQAASKIKAITGQDAEIEKANQYAVEGGMWKAKYVVASVQTLDRRGDRFNPDDWSLVIVDEAHHAPAHSYRRVLEHFRQNERCRVFGVTATPDRHDEEALGNVFDTVAFEYGVWDAIHDGWLVPIEQQFVHVDGLDFSDVRTTAGDLNGADLRQIMEFEETLHGVVHPTIEIVGDKKALVFAASVPHGERMCEIFNRHREGAAAFVHGKTADEERASIIDGYRAGRYQFLVNVGVATEGFDVPDVDVVVMARPTKSRALFCQMVGRGARPLAGLVDQFETAPERREAIAGSAKPHMMVIDFVGNSGKHKLITAADILGGNYTDEIVEAAVREMQENSGKPADVGEALKSAEEKLRRIKEEEERRARKRIKGKAHYTVAKFNPFNVFDLTEQRERPWNRNRELSEPQKAVLERNGVNFQGMSYTQCKTILDEIFQRKEDGLCTYKQARLLKGKGFNVKDMTFAEASRLITVLKGNGWRPPQGLVATVNDRRSKKVG